MHSLKSYSFQACELLDTGTFLAVYSLPRVEVLHVINYLSSTTCNASDVREWTNRDPILSKVKKYVLSGWPSSSSSLEEDFKPYKTTQNELSVEDGCVLWGSQVVIPPQGRKLVLEELHDTHPGSTKMKALAHCRALNLGVGYILTLLVCSLDTCLSC